MQRQGQGWLFPDLRQERNKDDRRNDKGTVNSSLPSITTLGVGKRYINSDILVFNDPGVLDVFRKLNMDTDHNVSVQEYYLDT